MARIKPKKGFCDGYEMYDTSYGFGDPSEWAAAFKYRMGVDAAKTAVGNDNPYSILGLEVLATWTQIRNSWKQRVRTCHPDIVGNDSLRSRFEKIQGAYELLAHQFGK